MLPEKPSWAAAAMVIVTSLLFASMIIGGLVVVGGQTWLLPGRTSPRSTRNLAAEFSDEELGFAEYVDRTLVLDAQGRLSIDGKEFADDELRSYLSRLSEQGGVNVILRVDADGPNDRRAAIENICVEATGMKPVMVYAVETESPLASESDLEAP